MLASTRPLALGFAASAALHAGLAALPNFGEASGVERLSRKPLAVNVVEAKRPAPTGAAPARRAERAGKHIPGAARYYTSAEVDVRAVPVGLKNSLRTSENFPLGRIVTVKLKLFINERGTLDRFEILEADHLPDQSVLDDFRAAVFRPAELGGRPVKSQKVVGISFVP